MVPKYVEYLIDGGSGLRINSPLLLLATVVEVYAYLHSVPSHLSLNHACMLQDTTTPAIVLRLVVTPASDSKTEALPGADFLLLTSLRMFTLQPRTQVTDLSRLHAVPAPALCNH